MSLYPELDGLSLTNLVDALHQLGPDGEEYDFAYYSDVAMRLRRLGEIGNTALWKEVGKTNTEQLRAILVALTLPVGTRPEVKPLTNEQSLALRNLLIETCLQSTEPLLVMEAIDGLSFLGEREVTDQVLGLRNHSSPFVRASVSRYMARLWPEQSFRLLVEALSDQDFIVRESAVDELGELGRPEAIPEIQPLLTDEHPDVRQAAQTAIEAITQIHASGGESK